MHAELSFSCQPASACQPGSSCQPASSCQPGSCPPAQVLYCAIGCLLGLHVLLLANGLTTAQYVRRFKTRGMRSVSDLLFRKGAAP